MNKSAIQKFAIWARTELIAQVSQKAYQYGITEEGYGEADAVIVGGHALTSDEVKQRRELVSQICQKGYTQVMEEVAYTWFNRFIALRFMEVNNYLPSHIRVFSDSTGAFKPEILSDALHLDLPGLDMDKVAAYIENNQTEDLYRYLLLTQCNALNEALPRMFEKMGGYTELLFPNNILRSDSILGHMVTDIPEEDWTDQVQIIGWLYQYYNSELKDDTFALLKKNVKITKERIPSATQLFTPDWIVRYMVENSLGRLWIEGHPDDELKSGWKYYLDEAEQEPDVQAQLDNIHAEYATLKPQDIKVIDPCMGSGHILVYAFDVLIQIYKKYGVSERDAAQSILQNNLYGLDIDNRAAQLAYFAVMMKTRQYDRRIFSRGIQPHVYAITESNGLDSNTIDYFANNDPKLKKDFRTLVDELRDAKEYGSILNITPVDFAALYARVEEVREGISLYRENVLNTVLPLIQVAEVMARKYDVVVTNPPYMGSGNMDAKLSEFVKKYYPDSKSDLFACFIERGNNMVGKARYNCMVTMQSWMFISSFEKLRESILFHSDITAVMHMETMVLGIAFGTVVSVFRKIRTVQYKGRYSYVHYNELDNYNQLEEISSDSLITRKNEDFLAIPGTPITYWITPAMLKIFRDNPCLSESFISGGRNKTHNDDKYLRYIWEVCPSAKWKLYAKGGDNRKWYGNDIYYVDWSKQARNEYQSHGGLINHRFWDKEGITWSFITYKACFRYKRPDVVYSSVSPTIFHKDFTFTADVLGYLNSCVGEKILSITSANLGTNVGEVLRTPYRQIDKGIVNQEVKQCIKFAKLDWDSYEISRDFQRHPLVRPTSLLSDVYAAWKGECEQLFFQLKSNEEELNRIFIDIYGLQDELTPEVVDKDVTVHRVFDTKDDVPESMQGSNYVRTKRDEIVSLISYAVGCMFGRYSLDVGGLVYAGGDFNKKYCRWISMFGDKADEEIDENGELINGGWAGSSMWKYDGVRSDGKWIAATYPPDTDNIIPICDDDYFDDDITGRFVKWVEAVYGNDTLEENLKFIADALGGKGTPREVIRSYFLNDFYADHCKTYQKRPIYWLFDSGKKNGFKALIYMHRYQSDLLARMRTDYVHEQQERYRTQLTHLSDALERASGSERVKLTKQQKKLQDQALEIQKYEEKIHHLADQNISIDLDDGVKHNYALFADVLAKIK